MAVWQVDFQIVPRRVIAASPDIRAALDDNDWWATVPFPSDYRTRLAAVATPAPSSSPDVESWGREDGNRVDVWSAGGRVTKARARVDVRRLDSKFGAAILEFVRTAGAVLVRGDGLIIEPIIGAYAGALRSSDAWRFASDPAEFIASQLASDDGDE